MRREKEQHGSNASVNGEEKASGARAMMGKEERTAAPFFWGLGSPNKQKCEDAASGRSSLFRKSIDRNNEIRMVNDCKTFHMNATAFSIRSGLCFVPNSLEILTCVLKKDVFYFNDYIRNLMYERRYRAIDFKETNSEIYSSLRGCSFGCSFFIRDMISMASGITTNTGIYIKGTMFFAT